jgi:hypothetical protein
MEVFLFIVWHHFIFMLIFKYLDLISIYFKRYLYKIIILIYSFVWLHLFLSPIHIIQEHTCVVKHCPALSLGFQSQHYRASSKFTSCPLSFFPFFFSFPILLGFSRQGLTMCPILVSILWAFYLSLPVLTLRLVF